MGEAKLENITFNESSPNGITKLNSKVNSKQLAYYNKNRERINTERKLKYRQTNGKNNSKENTPRVQDELTNLTNESEDNTKGVKKINTPCPENNGKNRPIVEFERTANNPFSRILTLDNVIKLAVEIHRGNFANPPFITLFGHLSNGKAKKQRFRKQVIFTEILEYIREPLFFNLKLETPNYKFDAQVYEKFKIINERTLRRYLVTLQKLHWIRKHGREYHLNPCLFQLFKIHENFILLLELASLKIDLFDVLNLPLMEASKHKIIDTQISYTKVTDKYYNEIFHGKMIISLTLEGGSVAQTILPVNVHPQNAYGKKVAHHCIPLDCSIVDLMDEPYYSTDYKRPHRKGAINENWNIHSDKSLTIPYMNKKTLHVRYKLRFHKQKTTSIKHWQNRVYLETDKIENLNLLFHERFVHGKRGLELYNALGMTLKPKGGRPEGSKNKPKKYEPIWKTMFEMEQEEN